VIKSMIAPKEQAIYIADALRDFSVIDVGDGEKLERWGQVLLRRPDPQVIWPKQNPSVWETAGAAYHRSASGGGAWSYEQNVPEKWKISYRELRFIIKPTGFKHTGLFPEQAANWDWVRKLLQSRLIEHEKRPRVLNLFAYTGGATLACAQVGASVCHVDAAKGMTQWARENYALNNLSTENVRWIVDDAQKFVQREVRRGNQYEGILMDPPSFGRGPGGEVWKLEDTLFELVNLCAAILSDDAVFFLINSYTTGLQPTVLQNLLRIAVCAKHGGVVEADEVVLPVESGGFLPCGASGRWRR